MSKNYLSERAAQRRIQEQYGDSVRLSDIGVGDFNESRGQWPVYVSCGSGSPAVYWVD